MPPDSPPSRGFRGLLKGAARRVKKALKPGGRATESHPPSPSPQRSLETPAPQPAYPHEQVPEPSAESQQPENLSQPVPSTIQPTATASLPAANETQLASPESKLSHAANKAGAHAWSGFKVVLQLLERSSDAFPPLKSAVAEFLSVVDVFETAAQNREDYAELALSLESMAHDFEEHPGEQTSSKMSEAINTMANGLRKEMEHVYERQQRSGFRRHLEAGQDLDDVQGCYRRVDTLCRELQNKALVQIWRVVEGQRGILEGQQAMLRKQNDMAEQQQVDARLKDLNAALEAMYDSSLSEVIGRRNCTPGTRKAILAEMRQWADNPDGPKVYWLNGMAGTGKTTLAYSFCAEMQGARRLGASFFCSRADASSRNVSRIVPTIAHQLARLLPEYREALIRQIGEDKDIGARKTETQFEKLIRDPFLEIKASITEDIVVTIDALDECDERTGAENILNLLFRYARDLPIKFFVTCRPEPGLVDVLDSESNHHRSVLHLHNIEASFVKADIKTYLEAELAAISLSPQKLELLVQQAGTLFIYAATAVRYIHPKNRKVNFYQRLEDLLAIESKSKTNKHRDIDDLYRAVVAAPFSDQDLNPGEKETVRLVLDTAVCAREPMSVSTMAKLLGLAEEQDLILALQHLRSVLHVSHSGGLISTLHASFADFMRDRDRSGDLCCHIPEHNRHLAMRCFSAMQRLLRFNICNLESSFVLDESVPGLAKKVDEAISPELFYACRYWGDHLAFVKALDDARAALEEFLSKQLMFWMEVMNLKNCIGLGAQILHRVHSWLQNLGGPKDTIELALDAARFATAFGMSPASRSTPHIYISALPFWPESRPVRQRYREKTQGLIKPEGSAMERRDLSCLATWTATGRVYCVAFSNDGTRIVSGSYDSTICVWDAHSGDVVAGPFKGHTALVWSVAFSSDGTRVVSGSADNTIRVWDVHSGLVVAGPFEGHTGEVHSVGFSPDDSRIVSGSADKTILVWDARSGNVLVGPFEGHTGKIRAVAFSPDGTRIASSSDDNTIRVWDARSGAIVARPFEGHTRPIWSIAFSPDGTRIVSGSRDRTILVWDALSGDVVAGPFQGHTDDVNSVAFSPDGTRIVSGSDDNTIRVWDAQSGLVVAGPFEGHTARVWSVTFSPDGTRIVSGSDDKTIRVWDALSRDVVAAPLQGHTDSIQSVGFSPDGTRIVSGSGDKTIRVWDACSGDVVAGPFEGHTSRVSSVAFSPNGTRIVSGSWDSTIRVWDVCSGDVVAGPFEGHTGRVYSVAFSSDGTRIVSGSSDKTIRVWDALSGDVVAGPLQGHTDWVRSVAFSPDDARIVSGSDDKTIRVWDAQGGLLVAGPFEGHTGFVMFVAFSPNGTHIVSGSADSTIRVWDARSGDVVAGPFKGHTGWVYSVTFSSDGTRIVSGSSDQTILVWDALNGDVVAGPFQGHTDEVKSVAFSPDSTRIVSGSDDKTIRVWDVSAARMADARPFTHWMMDQEGLVMAQQGQLLLCVPADLQLGLLTPPSTVCIYSKGSLSLDFDGVSLGHDWVKCYRS